MIRQFRILIFLVMAGVSFSVYSADFITAQNACYASASSYPSSSGTLVCRHDAVKWWTYKYNVNGTPSGVWEYFNFTGVVACPSGYDLTGSGDTSYCSQPVCPSGTVPANTVPALNTTLETCVNPTDQLCSSIGVDVNAFIARCSEMIDGQPNACRNSDMGNFALQACPKLQCEDGSEVTYPNPCPVTQCSEGFTLSDVPGYGKTCIKPLPDDEQQNPCVNVQGSDSALCAEDGRNCQMVNGSFVCIKEEIMPPAGATCYAINSKTYCLSNQPTLETTRGTETLPDGSVRTSETYQPSVQGVPASSRVTTQNPDGTVTTISNHPSDVAAAAGLQAQKIDLSKVEKNTKDTADNTTGILDKLTFEGEAQFDKSAIQFNDLDSQLESDRSEFQVFVNQGNPMQSYADSHSFVIAFSSMLPADTSCAGGIHTVIFGKHFDLEPCEKLAPLREILAWFFAVMTVWQIFNMTSKSITRF
ncbi:hypothetical protein [Methylomonas methanica]|uniref:Uncharacterized protein n=1 Tax=Methylomonas methanica (strain DSM 25384 / MC09) TaxID=857087 RepID=G0A213_METMM|nr:hypothetical protein [Methylomonas methanica]AEG02556.1 hypothetical protein Metme_4205 [Methylomonas methanica MC09]